MPSKIPVYRWSPGQSTRNFLLTVGLILSLINGILCQGGTPIQYSIMEEEPGGTIVGDIATDAGISNLDPQMTFTISSPQGGTPNLEYFALDTSSGRPMLLTTESINREKICAQMAECDIQFNIMAQPIQFFQIIKVLVTIEDRNDNQPTFPQQSISTAISESATPGTTFAVPSAEDLDSGVNGIKTYEIRPEEGKFGLEMTTSADGSVDLRLVLKEKLDRETQDTYQLTVIALDGGVSPRSGSMAVQVQVTDANDNSPTFTESSYEVTIREDVPVGYTIIQFTATDPDLGLNGQVVYKLADNTVSDVGDLFGIDDRTGALYTKRQIDFEEATSYHLSIMALDRGPNSLPKYVRILIHVTDVNNHAPKINLNVLTQNGQAQVMENALPGLFVAHISVEDADAGINGEIDCTLHSDYFKLEALYDKEFKVVTTTTFDREAQDQYHINIVCSDKGDPSMTSTKHIPVTVVDENDHTPEFGLPVYSAVILENNYIGQIITQLNATDGDEGSNAAVTYKTMYQQDEDIIAINAVTGIVTANTVFDYEAQVYYEIAVLATDHAESDAPRTATALVKISVTDTNDEPPKFILKEYSFSIEENKPENTNVGTISATDSDSEPFNEINFKLDPNTDGFEFFDLDPITGSLTSKQVLDREAKSEYHLKATTFNPEYPELTSSVNITVQVNDINDNSPVIVFPNELNNTVDLSNKLPKGYLVAKVQATDLDNGSNARLNYYFSKEEKVQELFTLDSDTGEIRVKDELSDLDHSTVRIFISVLDNGHPPLEAKSQLDITVNGSIPFVVTKPEPEKESVDEPVFSSKNWLTVGIIVGVFILLVIIVLLIAGCRRRRIRKCNKKHMYNCRLEEALKKQQQQQQTSPSAPPAYAKVLKPRDPVIIQKDKVLENGECLTSSPLDEEKQKIVLDLQMDVGESYTEEMSPDWPGKLDAALIMNPKLHSSLLSRNNSNSTRGSVPSESEFKQAYDQWKHMQIQTKQPPGHIRRSPLSPLTEMEKEVQDMIKMLATEKQGDADSLTDSGKGPSEPGETDKNSESLKRPSSEELPLADVHALAAMRHKGSNPEANYGNYVELENPKNSKNKMTRHESYDYPNKNPGLSVMVRRLSDPVVAAKPPELGNARKSPMLNYPDPKQAIPSHYHSNSNSSGSFYGSEGDPILYERDNSVYQSQLPPDRTYENTPLKGRSGSPRSKGRANELKVFDYPSGSEGHPRLSDSSGGSHHKGRDKHKHRSKEGRGQQQRSSKGKPSPTGNGPKQRKGVSYDRYPDIQEVLGEASYDSALDYNREQETQFLNSVYDSMYDDSSMRTSQLHSSMDSNADSMYSGRSASSHSPHRHSPHRNSPHRLSPHRQSPRLLSTPEVIIPQRLDFDDLSSYDSNHNNMSPHRQSPYDQGQAMRKSPNHNQVKDRSRSPHKLKREPHVHIKSDEKGDQNPHARGHHPHDQNYNYADIYGLRHSTPAKPMNKKRIIYRDPEECQDSAISEGDSSHGSGENLQSCVRDVVSQYMPGKTRGRDADSVDGLSIDSTTTSGSYVVDPDEFSSTNRPNLQLFGKEYLIV